MSSRSWYYGPVTVPIRDRREESPQHLHDHQDSENDPSSEEYEEEEQKQVEVKDPFSGKFGRFLLVEHEDLISPIGIINAAAAKSKLPLEPIVKPEADGSFACELYLNHLLLASGSAPSMEWAKYVAFHNALTELRREYYTLKYRGNRMETEHRNSRGVELNESNVGYRMMVQMGWSAGQSLGQKQVKLGEDRVYLNVPFKMTRQGLGFASTDPGYLMMTIIEYAASPSISDKTIKVHEKIGKCRLKRKMKELQINGHFKRDKLTKTSYLLLSKSNKCFEVAQMILDGIALDPEKNYELIPPSHKGSN